MCRGFRDRNRVLGLTVARDNALATAEAEAEVADSKWPTPKSCGVARLRSTTERGVNMTDARDLKPGRKRPQESGRGFGGGSGDVKSNTSTQARPACLHGAPLIHRLPPGGSTCQARHRSERCIRTKRLLVFLQ